MRKKITKPNFQVNVKWWKPNKKINKHKGPNKINQNQDDQTPRPKLY
jgi:hypothetical protein